MDPGNDDDDDDEDKACLYVFSDKKMLPEKKLRVTYVGKIVDFEARKAQHKQSGKLDGNVMIQVTDYIFRTGWDTRLHEQALMDMFGGVPGQELVNRRNELNVVRRLLYGEDILNAQSFIEPMVTEALRRVLSR